MWAVLRTEAIFASLYIIMNCLCCHFVCFLYLSESWPASVEFAFLFNASKSSFKSRSFPQFLPITTLPNLNFSNTAFTAFSSVEFSGFAVVPFKIFVCSFGASAQKFFILFLHSAFRTEPDSFVKRIGSPRKDFGKLGIQKAQ